MAKQQSRAARWNDAQARALSALEDLENLRTEYEEWRDNLPENLTDSAVGEKLSAVCDLDFSGAIETVEEAGNAELPQGFGRD